MCSLVCAGQSVKRPYIGNRAGNALILAHQSASAHIPHNMQHICRNILRICRISAYSTTTCPALIGKSIESKQNVKMSHAISFTRKPSCMGHHLPLKPPRDPGLMECMSQQNSLVQEPGWPAGQVNSFTGKIPISPPFHFPQATARVLCMIQSAQFWNKAKGKLQLLVYFWQNCLWVTLINETNYQPNRRQSLHYRSHQEWQWKWGEDGKSVVSAFPAAK